MKKKLAASLLALLCCFGMISCAKDAPVTTEEEITKEEVKTKEEVTEKADDTDLTYDVLSWVGFAEEGTLKEPGEQKVYFIEKAEDLDNFREAMNLSEEEEESLFAEPKDHVLLIEIVSETQNSSYGITSIYWEGTNVNVELHEEVLEEVAPSHTFILFHMPFSLVGNANVNISVVTA